MSDGEADQREAEVLLQMDEATLMEVKGAERVIVAKHSELLVIAITPTEEELAVATEQLKLPPGSLKPTAEGRPLVFLLCSDYKIPVHSNVPCIQESLVEFVFAVPNLWMAVKFPEDTDEDILEAFEMLVKQYGTLRRKPGYDKAKTTTPTSSSTRSIPQATPAQQYTSNGYGAPVASAAVGGATAVVASSRDEEGGQGVAEDPNKPKLSSKIVGGIGALTGLAVRGIRKGTKLATGGLSKGSNHIVTHTKACEKPVHVPEEYSSKVRQARTVTKSAVLVSGGVATAMVGVSAVLGSGIATVAGGALGKIAPKSKDPKFDGVKEVGAAAIGGAATVFVEATDAARILLTASCDGISRVVHHKFGNEVGQATQDTLGLVQDGVAVQQNMKTVGLKAIAKRTAKHAGGQLKDQYFHEDDEDQPPQPPAYA